MHPLRLLSSNAEEEAQLPLAFCSSRGHRGAGRGRGGGEAQPSVSNPVDRALGPGGDSGRGAGASGRPFKQSRHEEQRGEGRAQRAETYDAFVSHSMVEDPWARLQQAQR